MRCAALADANAETPMFAEHWFRYGSSDFVLGADGGLIIDYFGDGMMAAFGAPVVSGSEAEISRDAEAARFSVDEGSCHELGCHRGPFEPPPTQAHIGIQVVARTVDAIVTKAIGVGPERVVVPHQRHRQVEGCGRQLCRSGKGQPFVYQDDSAGA